MEDRWKSDICDFDEVPEGGARGFSVTGEDGTALRLIVVRMPGGVRVYENRCPHRGTPLDWAPDRFLDDTGEFLVCSTHAALFRIEDGECVSGPCPGEFLKARTARLCDGRLFLMGAAKDSPPSED
ncbi:MAG: Rieske 2Fe-2S domain-containing protein [Myxococcota bacterium]|nr:Rieske 2Fe-2S domain-containing protein [Myxococcota bacterium]